MGKLLARNGRGMKFASRREFRSLAWSAAANRTLCVISRCPEEGLFIAVAVSHLA
jgi:hypothetical protein